MATYYVKSGGNDAADGLSDGNAWETISKVDATATSGDTVYFRSQDTWTNSSTAVINAIAGVTYNGSYYGTGTRATLQATGTLTDHGIIDVKASSVSITGFDLDGNSQICSGIEIADQATADISNITIDDCVIHDCDGINQAYYGIHVGHISSANKTVSNVTIRNCTVYNVAYEGIAIYPSWSQANDLVDTVTIQNCEVYNTGQVAYGVGVMIANNCDNITVEDNNLHDNSNGVEVGTSGSTYTGSPNNVIVRNNLLHSNTSGIVVNHTQNETLAADAVFYGNIIYGTGPDINIANSGSGNFGTSAFSFYNNTVYNSTSEVDCVRVARYAELGGTPTINFKNNIVMTATCTGVHDSRNLLTHSNNLIRRTDSTNNEHVNNGTSYNRSGVTTWEATARTGDPAFVNATTDFHIEPSSDAINYGTSITLPDSSTLDEDYDGNAIKIGTNPDIGAYEYWGKFFGTQSIASIMGVTIGNISQISGLSKAAA